MTSSGTLIGAILESTGYHYQAAILDALGDPLSNQVGGLVYLVGLVIALTMVATQNSYKMGVWLLIGPPLFFAVIGVRSSLPNADWSFGKQMRDSGGQVDDGVQNISKGAVSSGEQANVSTVFRRYVQMISAVTKELVAVISKDREKTDRWFILKGELFARLHTQRAKDKNFHQLVQGALLNQCGDVIYKAQQVGNILLRDPAGADTPGEKAKAIAEEYSRQSRQQAEEAFNTAYKIKDKNLSDGAAEWLAVKLQGAKAPTPSAGAGSAEYEKTLSKLKEDIKNRSVSCEFIWMTVVDELVKQAKERLESLNVEAEEYDIDRAVINNLFGQVHGIESDAPITYSGAEGKRNLSAIDVETIARLIAKYYLHNEVSDRSKTAWFSMFATRHDYRRVSTRLDGYNSTVEQAKVLQSEWAEKEKLIHAAGSLPYYQGLGLYFLGAIFPFFALLLLIPGKQAGMMLWFMLWLWLKSWDIGFAVVMLLDEVVYSMIAVQNQAVGDRPQISQDFALEMASLKLLDPTFQLATQYSLVAVCLLSIPVVSAHLILGGVKGGAALISAGVAQEAEHFASSFLAKAGQLAITGLKQESYLFRDLRTQSYLRNAAIGQAFLQRDMDRRNSAAGSVPSLNTDQEKGSSHVGPDPRQKAPTSGKQLSQTPELTKQEQAEASYFTKFATPLKAFGETKYEGGAASLDHAIKGITASKRNLPGAMAKARRELRETDRKNLVDIAMWHEEISQDAIDLHEMIAIYGAIPIPWSNFETETSGTELELVMRQQVNERNVRAAIWKTMGESWKEMGEFWKEWRKGSDGSSNLDDLSRLSPADQQRFWDDWKNYISNKNILLHASETAKRSLSLKDVKNYAYAGVEVLGVAAAKLSDSEKSFFEAIDPLTRRVDSQLSKVISSQYSAPIVVGDSIIPSVSPEQVRGGDQEYKSYYGGQLERQPVGAIGPVAGDSGNSR